MSQRPILSIDLCSRVFREYYYMKEELIDFCRQNGLQTTGGKIEITNRIAHFLDTGEKVSTKTPPKGIARTDEITETSLIEPNFVCSEKHRVFFEQSIGKGFTFFVSFQKWLKANSGKTYQESIAAYYELLDDKKKGTSVIDRQFEYNTYIRDFFADNPGKSLAEAIRCWKYKKGEPGHNRYEKEDLTILP